MKLLIGLGNPGPKYELTRHNAGFWVLDLIAAESNLKWEDATNSKFLGWMAKGQVLGQSCVCLKPSTFMNVSGRCVQAVAQFFKVPSSDWIVFHDDIDLIDMKVRARVGGGHGGHNGIRSIIAETGFDDFKRIKLGVGRPAKLEDGRPLMDVADYVLQKVTSEFVAEYVKQVKPDVWQRLKDFL